MTDQASADLRVEGMTCAACVQRVERVLGRLDGVASASVNLATERARVVFDAEPLGEAPLVAALQKAGFGGSLVAAEDSHGGVPDRSAEVRELGSRLAVAVPLTLPVFAMAMFGLEVPAADLLQWALTTVIVFWAGRGFFVKAATLAIARTANMDTLVAIGTLAAYALSVVNVVSSRLEGSVGSELYFETAAVIVSLILFGRLLEARAKGKAAASISALASLQASEARRIDPETGAEHVVPVEDLVVGDLVLLKPGERIPVDGVLVSGRGAIDESMLTGEPMPQSRLPGDEVLGGTVNTSSALTVRVNRVGEGTTLARIRRLVEEAQSSRAPVQRLADRVAAVFVPVVLGIAGLTLLGWLTFARAAPSQAILAVVAVLVIACPCALGLATPTAVLVGSGRAARMGILIKDAAELERLSQVDTVIFDKTGTLTEGRPVVAAAKGAHLDKVLPLLAGLEAQSEHPLAAAVCAHAESLGLEASRVEEVTAFAGLGVSGTSGVVSVLAGTDEFLREAGFEPEGNAAWVAEQEALGRVVFHGAVTGCEPVALSVEDPVRAESAAAVASLHRLGISTLLLSGDSVSVVERVGRQVGMGPESQLRGRLKPEDKARILAGLQEKGHVVAMIGDGINDAPALARADVGMAIGSGADVALETAGVALLRSDPRGVADAIALARTTLRTIKQNLFWAFAYNVIGIPVAALGLLNPMFSAFAMAFSSVSVVTNSLFLRTKRLSSSTS